MKNNKFLRWHVFAGARPGPGRRTQLPADPEFEGGAEREEQYGGGVLLH